MKLKQLIKESLQSIFLEELDIPSPDGTSDSASEEEKDKAKKATEDGDEVKFVKPGELEESGKSDIKEEEVLPKVKEVFSSLQAMAEEAVALEEFADNDGDNKMKKLAEKLAKSLSDASKLVGEMKQSRDSIMQEDAEKADIFGDKVVKALGKYCKDEEHGKRMKEKYMPYIAKAHKKGKSAKDIAERIKDHRFEI